MHSFWLLPCGWSIEQGSSFLNPGRRLYPAGVLCISHTCTSLQQCGRISLEPGRPRALEIRPTVVGVRAACVGRLCNTGMRGGSIERSSSIRHACVPIPLIWHWQSRLPFVEVSLRPSRRHTVADVRAAYATLGHRARVGRYHRLLPCLVM